MNNMEILNVTLEVMLEDQKSFLHKIKDEYETLPNGRLYITSRSGNHYFTEYTGDAKRSVTKDRERVHVLARREYLGVQIDKTEKVIEKLEELRKSTSQDNIYLEKIKKRFYMLDKDISSEFKWSEEEFFSNPYKPEQLKYTTGRGVKARSKSELIIANKLESKNIEYRYEGEIFVEGKSCYPDFTILRHDGKLIFWEHLGLMDADDDYYYRALVKMNKYRRAGIRQHDNLICTYEEDLAAPEEIERIIRKFILSVQ